MRHVYYALCWLGWWGNRGGWFHAWAQQRYLHSKYPVETWKTMEEVMREYGAEES